jgi:hypothetical protein
MFTVNRIFEVSQALEISYFNSFSIPYTFNINQRQLIITVHNSSNINQVNQGVIIPFSNYGISGELEYFQKTIYTGNQLLQINPIDDFKLKFRPYRNGEYFITIDEVITDLIG